MRALTVRAVLFAALGDFFPLYAVYALLFADHGLNAGQISSLFALWSATAFLLEVPSGAWADTVSRRGLLILSGVLLTAGFTLWTVLPTYLGFAAGFVVWGISGALQSGTFEALLYDELSARGEPSAFPRILGYSRAATETAALIAILAATPLYLVGGYPLIGWVSVAMAAAHTVVACTLPAAPKAVSTAEVDELDDETAEPAAVEPRSTARPIARYLSMLRSGVREATRIKSVRNGVLLGALLYGITAFDEYFALVAGEAGVATAVVPLLVAVTVVGSLIGSVTAGRTETMRARTMGIAVAVAGVLFIAGAVVVGLAVRWPAAVYVLTGSGFIALGISYGIVYNATVVAEARLQDAIEGPARATVTSVSGLLSEVVSLMAFGFVALVTVWLSMSATVALLGFAVLAIAAVTPAWLPRRSSVPSRVVDHSG
ncbi:MFS transporter [Nocardia cyriacigeorgica]|uniref:MFS transporter n=1 Tax=Nocardia cyriacigeorgica TaxID=135487 RepID=UPI002456E919|nr:MFS transporter [Nocardia cyriacigeorgica]